MVRVLFVCTGNTCRSPMAEAAARRVLGDLTGVEFASAGLAALPGEPASNHARFVAHDRGEDLESHRSRRLDEDMIRHADLVLTMTAAHAQAARRMAGPRTEHVSTLAAATGTDVDVDDPFGGTLEDYVKTHDRIERMLEDLRPRLEALRDSVSGGR